MLELIDYLFDQTMILLTSEFYLPCIGLIIAVGVLGIIYKIIIKT